MNIPDGTIYALFAGLLGAISTLGSVIYATLKSAISTLEIRVEKTEKRADACEEDRQEMRTEIDSLKTTIDLCPNPSCPLNRKKQ